MHVYKLTKHAVLKLLMLLFWVWCFPSYQILTCKHLFVLSVEVIYKLELPLCMCLLPEHSNAQNATTVHCNKGIQPKGRCIHYVYYSRVKLLLGCIPVKVLKLCEVICISCLQELTSIVYISFPCCMVYIKLYVTLSIPSSSWAAQFVSLTLLTMK